MAASKRPRRETQRTEKKQKCITIVEEVDALEDLAPRMQELALSLTMKKSMHSIESAVDE